MSQIDIQNAKQIRDPMTVLISMEVPEDVAVNYTGFENVKIEDAQLGQRAWPMRQLADLQGEGFALDGSRSLYDPNVTASAANGKIGIRGDVGEDVTFTVSGDSNINGLSLAATGTDRVLFNGQTATFSDGQVIIPVGSDSITLTFPAEETDRRVEVSFTLPGTSLKVTNDSIISCIVSLRADLTIDNPTLPESEINIEVYNDVDISEVVASIPDDSPLTYSAGYTGDMSPERQFYISGQVTWADNVLTIHGVDAVHFLDKEISPYDIMTRYQINAAEISKLDAVVSALIGLQGISVDQISLRFNQPGGVGEGNPNEEIFFQRGNLREIISFLNNVFKIDNVPEAALYFTYPASIPRAYWFNYVDAGIPTLTSIKQGGKWSIQEEDCGDIKKDIDVAVGSVSLIHQTAQINLRSAGTVTWMKDGPAFPSFDGIIYGEMSFISPIPLKYKQSTYYGQPVLPASTSGWGWASPKNITGRDYYLRSDGRRGSITFGFRPLIDEGTLQNLNDTRSGGGIIYTQILPANPYRDSAYHWVFPTLKDTWAAFVAAGEISADDTSLDVDIHAYITEISEEEKEYISATSPNGRSIEIKAPICGSLDFGDSTQQTTIANAYPDMAIQSLLERSNITGSFVWKGDPRMQPRDVAEFHRLDGTVEEITLENITLHHEGGGTYAEITYRKGVC